MTDYAKWAHFERQEEADEAEEAVPAKDSEPACADLLDQVPEQLTRDLALCLAARENKLHVVQELLREEGGAEVDGRDPQGRTALHIALHHPAAEGRAVVEALLGADASVNVEAKNGDTPLSLGALQGHEQLIDCLLEGTTVSEKALNHALYSAAKYARPLMARRLMRAGANPWGYDDWGLRCLHHWSRDGDVALMRAALLHTAAPPGGPEACATSLDFTPLHVAVRSMAPDASRTDAVDVLLEAKADANRESLNGETPLNLCRALAACRKLVEFGAEVNAQPRLHKTALVAQVEGRRHNIVRFLLEKNADPNLGQLSPLCTAVRKGDAEGTRLLLRAGAQADLRESLSGALPLVLAADQDDAAIVEALLEEGDVCDPRLTDARGATALGRCTARAVAALLVARGADVNALCVGKAPLVLAAGSGNVDTCQFLLDAGALVDVMAPCTPLMAAAANGQEETCALLLARRANPELEKDNLTARALAERSECSNIVALLDAHEARAA